MERFADIRNGPGEYALDVVGEGQYQDALEQICGGRTEDSQRRVVEAILVHEDDNPYDPKAVRIDIAGQTVGYLDRDTARSFRKELAKAGAEGLPAKCRAMVVGGWDRGGDDLGNFGVKLDLPIGGQ